MAEMLASGTTTFVGAWVRVWVLGFRRFGNTFFLAGTWGSGRLCCRCNYSRRCPVPLAPFTSKSPSSHSRCPYPPPHPPTTTIDMYFHQAAVAPVVDRVGMRAVLGVRCGACGWHALHLHRRDGGWGLARSLGDFGGPSKTQTPKLNPPSTNPTNPLNPLEASLINHPTLTPPPHTHIRRR